MSQSRQRPATTRFRSLSGGEVVPPHLHDAHHVVYASVGVLSVSTDDGTWVAPADRALWVPAGTLHTHRAFGATTLLTVAVSRRTVPAGLAATTVLGVGPLLRELLLAVGAAGAPRTAADRRLRAVLLDQLGTAAQDRALHLPAARDARLRAAEEVLDADPGASLTEVAHRVAAAPRTLSRLCRDELGMTFPQWRTQLRLHHALRLLAAEPRSVTSVAQRTGWTTTSAFVDVFRRHLGYTPGRRRPAGG